MKNILFLLDFADSLANCEKVGSLPRDIRHFKTLSDNSLEVHVISPDTSNYTGKFNGNAFHHNLPHWSQPIKIPVYLFLMPFLKKSTIKRCDLIWAKFSSSVPAVLAKKIFAKPMVVLFDYNWVELSIASCESRIEQTVKKIIERLIIANSDHIITTTATLKEYLVEKGFPHQEKIHLVPNSVDTDIFSPKDQFQRSGTIKILSVGRLNEQKNFPLLIDSVSTFQKQNQNDTKLTIVGSGPLKKKLLEMAQVKNVSLNIIDRIPNNEMPDVYINHDVFVMTSPQEGHPRAIIEAMACGLPVIGTNVTGIRDVIIDGVTGLLCAQHKDDVAGKISAIVHNEKIAGELGWNARLDIVKKCSIAALTKREAKIYKSI